MQVTAADSASRNLENDISVFNNLWLGTLDHFDLVLAHPGEGFHLFAWVAILLAVEGSRASNVLLSRGIVAVTDSLLQLQSSL